MVIAPWNYPYLTAVNTIVPGLMAGNAVILKHAAQTLLVGERFAEAFRRAGLPEGPVPESRHVARPDREADRLRQDRPHQLHRLGRRRPAIERAAAGTFTTLGLELGGKDPAYVLADAKLDHAVENLVDGAFYNSGQCCCGIERIYVDAQASMTTSSKAAADSRANTWSAIRSTRRPRSGPMARGAFADMVREQTAEALRKGANAHINMKVDGDRPGSPYLAPEVLTNVNHQMA